MDHNSISNEVMFQKKLVVPILWDRFEYHERFHCYFSWSRDIWHEM